MPPPTEEPSTTHPRRIVAVTALALGVIVFAWSAATTAVTASSTHRAEVVARAIAFELEGRGSKQPGDVLQLAVERYRDHGLLYAEITDSHGVILASHPSTATARAASTTVRRPARLSPDPARAKDTLLVELDARASRRDTRLLTGLGLLLGGLVLTLAGFGLAHRHRPHTSRRPVEPARPPAPAQPDRLRSIGQMSAVLAHEIRNPLASLKGHAQLLAEQVDDNRTEARKVARIVSEASRLEKLTADLLDFSRADQLDRQRTDVLALVEACRRDVDKTRITLDTTEAPDVWSLDRLRLYQVLTNLLRNAVQASPANAPVELLVDTVTGADGTALRLRVRNRGDGLPAGKEDEIFEPFFTTRTRGTGLGLAVARRIITLHGGTLSARNRSAGGAELEARIPAA